MTSPTGHVGLVFFPCTGVAIFVFFPVGSWRLSALPSWRFSALPYWRFSALPSWRSSALSSSWRFSALFSSWRFSALFPWRFSALSSSWRSSALSSSWRLSALRFLRRFSAPSWRRCRPLSRPLSCLLGLATPEYVPAIPGVHSCRQADQGRDPPPSKYLSAVEGLSRSRSSRHPLWNSDLRRAHWLPRPDTSSTASESRFGIRQRRDRIGSHSQGTQQRAYPPP